MKKLIFPLLLVLILLGGLYAYYLYPPIVLYRKTQESLMRFAAAVETQDRMKAGEALQALLTEDAKVRLEITFFSMSNIGGSTPVIQDFDKTSFMSFIDNVLYTLTDYHYRPQLQSVDIHTGAVNFTSSDYSDGTNYYGGVSVGMRFSTDAQCEGIALFVTAIPQLKQADCKIRLQMVPKPQDAAKLQNIDSLKDLLR